MVRWAFAPDRLRVDTNQHAGPALRDLVIPHGTKRRVPPLGWCHRGRRHPAFDSAWNFERPTGRLQCCVASSEVNPIRNRLRPQTDTQIVGRIAPSRDSCCRLPLSASETPREPGDDSKLYSKRGGGLRVPVGKGDMWHRPDPD
jgi:hypothetical protein